MGQQGRGRRRDARARRWTRAQHATSPSRPTSCPPGDVKKLQNAGIYTCNGLMMHTDKNLTGIKGLSEAKVDQICEAAKEHLNQGFMTGTDPLLKVTEDPVGLGDQVRMMAEHWSEGQQILLSLCGCFPVWFCSDCRCNLTLGYKMKITNLSHMMAMATSSSPLSASISTSSFSMRTPSDYMCNQSEFGPKMLGIRGILAFHFAQRSSALKAVKGSKKI